MIVGVINDGNDLTAIVDGDVTDARALVEVAAVNALRTGAGESADLEDKSGGEGGVLLVVLVVGFDEESVTRESLGPVALLAGLAGGTQVLHRGRNGTRIGFKGDSENLSEA